MGLMELIKNKDVKNIKKYIDGLKSETIYNDKVEKAIDSESKKNYKKQRSQSPTSITEDLEKAKKTYKEKSLMKAKSELKKKGDSYTVDTEMNVRKGLDAKVKRALKKSVVEELDKKISGSGIRKIDLDMSSDEEEKPKRRGRPKKKVEESSSESEEEEPKRRRPKKGKGIEYDSSSDEDEIKTYGQMLKHLVSHIKDPKEPIDPKDYKQAIQLIKRIKSKKA